MVAKSGFLRLLIAGLACAAIPLGAQQQAPSPLVPPQGQQGLGRPGPEGRRLAFLVGKWQERVSYPAETPEQKNEEGTGQWFARPMLGRFIQFNYEGTGPQGVYRAFGILAYDREAQNFRLLWFDDSG